MLYSAKQYSEEALIIVAIGKDIKSDVPMDEMWLVSKLKALILFWEKVI